MAGRLIELGRRATPSMDEAPEKERLSWANLVAEAHFRLALDFLKNQRHEAVLAEIERALTWLPEDGIYLYHLGLAFHRLGRFEEAFATYERPWQIEPSWRVAYDMALAALQGGELFSSKTCDETLARLESVTPERALAKAAIERA